VKFRMSHTHKMTLASLAVLIIISLMGLLLIWPNYRRASAVWHQVEELNSRIDRFGSQAEEQQRLAAQLKSIEGRVLNELKVIPSSADLATLIRKLSQVVDRVRVLDQTFTAGTPGAAIIGSPSSMQAMPLTVDMQATFDSVFALLQNAESIDRLVRVNSVRVICKRDEKNAETMNESPIVKATVGLEAIFDAPTGETN
jgi:Tfp pilus assembly protein PilO